MTTPEQTALLTRLGFEQGHTYIVDADGSFREARDEERREEAKHDVDWSSGSSQGS